jgi:MFS family permease
VSRNVTTMRTDTKSTALRFVLLVGVMSFFADFTYEGSRAVLGPYLALLGASGTAVGIVTGFGECVGYGLRVVSGHAAERTRQFWPITIGGYVVQMAAVPALALAGSWPVAAGLLVLERVGKAIRNPPRDVMLSHAAGEMGYGWGFGVHEALDQFGAMVGPLIVATLLAKGAGYRVAFTALLVPALVTLTVLGVARLTYPRPEELESAPPVVNAEGLPRVFWIYLVGAGLVGAGFADYPLIAYHFQKTSTVSGGWVAVFYAIAMGLSGVGSLAFGRFFDRFGVGVLVPLTIVSTLFAPLAFLGGFWPALCGAALWGLGMGVHESIVPAAVAPMVPPARRASAYGLFTAVYGFSWFAGSAVIGILYDVSIPAVIAFCIAAELAAVPFLLAVAARQSPSVAETGIQPPPRS